MDSETKKSIQDKSKDENSIVQIIRNKLFILAFFTASTFMFIGIAFMYTFTKPFPKGPDGFLVSGHPVFYMISEAFMAFTLFTIAFISSILYIWKRKTIYDTITLASAKTGILASALTLLIGILWSKVEWGYFWQWEPRQTMTLLMFLFYTSLIIFRSTVEQEDKAKLTAVFGIAAFPTVPMTNFIVGALHPNPQATTFSSFPFIGIILLFIGTFFLYMCLLLLTIKLEQLQLEVEKKKYILLANQ